MQHLWKGDGYHILKNSRPLLVKSVAAAVVGVNPRQQFGLARPPFGQYGPWPAQKGAGVLPSYRDRAMAQPFLFRHSAGIRPLMCPYIGSAPSLPTAPIRPLMNHIRRFN